MFEFIITLGATFFVYYMIAVLFWKETTVRRQTGEEYYSNLYGKDWGMMKPFFTAEELK